MNKPNPFTNKRPINNIEGFYFHHKLVERIFCDYINNPELPCLSLVAEKGMGKSTLLNALLFQYNREEYFVDDYTIMVYLDFAESMHEISDFYKTIQSSINSVVQESNFIDNELKGKLNSIYNNMLREKDLFVLQENFKDMMRKLSKKDYKTVMIIDNFDEAVDTFQLSYNEFNFLRTLANPKFNVQYIIASIKSLDKISEDTVTSQFYNIFTKELIPPFNKEAVNTYVLNNFNKLDIEISESETKWILEASGGYPSVLRSACKCLLNQKQKDRTYDNYKEFLTDINKECYTIFDSIIKRTTIEERECLKALADNTIEADDYSLKSLCDRLILTYDTSYKFTSEAFKYYIETINLDPYIAHEEISAISENVINKQDDVVEIIKNIMQQVYFSLAKSDEEDFGISVKNVKNAFASQINLNSSENLLLKMDKYNFWSLLEEESKENLIIAEKLYELYGDSNLDLAFISLLYCRSIELEINTKLLPCIQSKLPQLTVKEQNITDRHFIMIGELFFSVCYNDDLKQFIQKSNIDLYRLKNELHTLKDIRNNTAHSNGVVSTRIDKFIIDKLRNIIYNKNEEGFFNSVQKMGKRV